ncbi:MAG: SPOR domain-containing protein [Gemmatimonadota bacterium]
MTGSEMKRGGPERSSMAGGGLRRIGPLAFLPAVLLTLGLAASPRMMPSQTLAAQEAADSASPPTLDEVEELVRMGRTEEARVALARWWETSWDREGRRRHQRALWLRGRLTTDPDRAVLDFRRLAIEYPGSFYAAEALFRLAQAAYAAGSMDEARRYVQELARTHPGSSTLREARRWLEAAPPPPPVPAEAEKEAEADRDAAGAAAEGGAPQEATAGDSAAARGRAEGEAPSRAAPPTREATPTREAPPGGQGRSVEDPAGTFAVQVGAFAGEGRARALLRRLEEAGLQPRLVRVPGSRLLRVRVGRFVNQADALTLMEEVRSLGFPAALARDAHRERSVR